MSSLRATSLRTAAILAMAVIVVARAAALDGADDSTATAAPLPAREVRLVGAEKSPFADELRRRLGSGEDSSLADVWTTLAEAGFLEARLCREIDSLAILTLGAQTDHLRLVWRSADDSISFARLADRLPSEARLGGGSFSAALSASAARALEICLKADRPLSRLMLAGYSASPEPVVTVDVALGPQVSILGLRFTGANSTRESFLRRVTRFRGREPYRHARWLEARESLLQTGLFESVSDPALLSAATIAGRPATGDSIGAEILFRLRERQVNTARGVIGYSGEQSTLAGYVDLALGNLFGTGRAARLFWRRDGEERGRFEIAWHEPFLWTLPLGFDLRLEHEVEDTLYADTRWGGEFLWVPAAGWTASFGWQGQRLTAGAEIAGTIRRSNLLLGLRRQVSDPAARPRGWEFRAELNGMRGDLPEMVSVAVRAREWIGGSRWGFAGEQSVGYLSDSDRYLRSDAFRVGGANSMRGYNEGRYRATRYGVQRLEWGPNFGGGPPRIYALLDLGWLETWEPIDSSPVYGSRGDRPFLWSGGIGLRMPTRGGIVHCDYAVPEGETLGHGRLHLGIESRF